MRRRTRTQVAALAAVAVGVGLAPIWATAADASSVPGQVRAAWSFDDVTKAGKVSDFSGHGNPMALSGAWSATSGKAGTTAAEFGQQSVGSVSVPSPGDDDFAVTLVLKELNPLPLTDSPNLFQLGLYGDSGQVKVQIADTGRGQAQCRFKGTAGAVLLTGPAIDVSNGAWHKVTCWRQGGQLGVTVDGVAVKKSMKVGSIVVTRAATLAGRGLAKRDASDQFVGIVDAGVWAVGSGAKASSINYASTVVHQS